MIRQTAPSITSVEMKKARAKQPPKIYIGCKIKPRVGKNKKIKNSAFLRVTEVAAGKGLK